MQSGLQIVRSHAMQNGSRDENITTSMYLHPRYYLILEARLGRHVYLPTYTSCLNLTAQICQHNELMGNHCFAGDSAGPSKHVTNNFLHPVWQPLEP